MTEHEKMIEVAEGFSVGQSQDIDELKKTLQYMIDITRRVDTVKIASLAYEILEKYPTHNLAEHEDRQDIGWSIMESISIYLKTGGRG